MFQIYSSRKPESRMASSIVENGVGRNYVIFTDSLSTLYSLTDKNTNNSISRRVQHRAHGILNTKHVELCWIPSHTGIDANAAADRAAKAATTRPYEVILLPYSDWYPSLKEKIFERWKIAWQMRSEKLKTIKNIPGAWRRLKCTRREEVVVNRLRSGHTWITHNYLMNGTTREPPPICPMCNDDVLDVLHILLKCTRVEQLRIDNIKVYREKRDISLAELLGDKIVVTDIFRFLKRINAYDQI